MVSSRTNEIWKPIPDYEGVYDASNYGRIRRRGGSHLCKSDRILKPGLDKHGYQMVTLSKHNRKRSKKIHQLVMLAFVGEPPPDKPSLNHKNGIKIDNTLDNLEYVSVQENVLHACRVLGHGRGENHGGAKLTELDVIDIRIAADAGAKYEVLAQKYGISRFVIGQICRGKLWLHVDGPIQGKRRGGTSRKLTEQNVRDIRQLYANGGITQQELANEFGVSFGVVSAIVRRKIWAHVE